MKKYFAYGSCTNIESFEKTLNSGGDKYSYAILGVGRMNNYKLAFTRKTSAETGALDIIESQGDYVLGVVYEIPEEAIYLIDRREGFRQINPCYNRLEDLKIFLGDEEITVFTYVVADKYLEEVCPSEEYFNTLLEGMKYRLPIDYINRYLIDNYNNKFGKKIHNISSNRLYHFNSEKETEFMKGNAEMYQLLKQMMLFLGDYNERVNTIKPTPEMFRILVKCVEMAARDELYFNHMIPRGLFNKLASEFQRISGVETIRV